MELKYRTKIFLFFLGLILFFGSFWVGMRAFGKNLENFFLWKITRYQTILPAAILNPLQPLKPTRNWKIEDLEIQAWAAISVEINGEEEKILFKKNKSRKLPIASLTKLMTASLVLENYNLSHLLEIDEEVVSQEGEQGELKIGEVLSIKNLLYIMLIESSNDAAYALSEIMGSESFVGLMNRKAKSIGLENSYFGNPTGLDPINPFDSINYSTAEDLIKLTKYLLKNQSLIWEILSLKEFELYRPNGTFHHKLKNTNEFLRETPFLINKRQTKIVGGKTGWTPKSNGCLLLVLKSPENESYLMYVILSSNNKFEKMKKLINWTNEAYNW